jgi:hypothetical protein
MDLRDTNARLTGIHEAIRQAKADGIDRTDPRRFAFLAESYWILRRDLADRDERETRPWAPHRGAPTPPDPMTGDERRWHCNRSTWAIP